MKSFFPVSDTGGVPESPGVLTPSTGVHAIRGIFLTPSGNVESCTMTAPML